MENESKYELQSLEPVDEIKLRVVILKKYFCKYYNTMPSFASFRHPN